jgi:hypothetical protein
MDRLFADWSRRVEVEAKTLEHQLQPASIDNQGDQSAERDLNQAKERIRYFEGEIANIESKIAAFQQSLSALIVQGGPALQIKGVETALRRLNQQKADLIFRRDDWRIAEQSASIRLHDAKQRSSLRRPGADSSKGTTSVRQLGVGAGYRSETKIAIRRVLAKKPDATAGEVCRLLDNSETDLPRPWDVKGDRLFASAYKDPKTRLKITKLISKVRADVRESRKK